MPVYIITICMLKRKADVCHTLNRGGTQRSSHRQIETTCLPKKDEFFSSNFHYRKKENSSVSLFCHFLASNKCITYLVFRILGLYLRTVTDHSYAKG